MPLLTPLRAAACARPRAQPWARWVHPGPPSVPPGAPDAAAQAERQAQLDVEEEEAEAEADALRVQHALWAQTAQPAHARPGAASEREHGARGGAADDWLAAMTGGKATARPLHFPGLRTPRRGLCTSAHARAHARVEDEVKYPAHPDPTPYEIFALPRSAGLRDIKARYYLLCKQLHPDVGGKTDDQTQAQFRSVVAAYELLRDPKARRMYDQYNMGWGSPRPRSARGPDAAGAPRRPRSEPWGRGPAPDEHFRYHYRPDAAWAGPTATEMRAANAKFALGMMGLCVVAATWVYTLIESYAGSKYEQVHFAAAQSLSKARDEALSPDGQTRMNQLRERARMIRDQRRPKPLPSEELRPSPGEEMSDETAPAAFSETREHWDVLPPPARFRRRGATASVEEL